MPTITVLYPDESVEVVQTPDARAWIVDNIPGVPCLIPGWTLYGDRPCQVWYGFNAGDINLDASALYLLACAPDMANASDYHLFGPVAIVQE
jgi:hypothetical protein